MKWPVTSLEGRLKASIRKLFSSRRSESKNINSVMKISANPAANDDHLCKCKACNSDDQLIENQASSLVTLNYLEPCHKLPVHRVSDRNNDSNLGGPIMTDETYPKILITADASVNTDKNETRVLKDAYSQAYLDELPVYFHPVQSDTTVSVDIPRMCLEHVIRGQPNTDQPTDYTYQPEASSAEYNTELKSKNNFSDHANSISFSSHHCSDPLLFDRMLSVNTNLDYGSKCCFNAGDSCTRQVNSSIACLEPITDHQTYPTQWSCEALISQYHGNPISQAMSHQHCLSQQAGSLFEIPPSSQPRTTWYELSNPCRHNSVTYSNEDSQSSPSENRRVFSEMCIPSSIKEVSQKSHSNKSTKECGDACQRTILSRSNQIEANQATVHVSFSMANDRKKWPPERNRVQHGNIIRRTKNKETNRIGAKTRGQVRIGRDKQDELDSTADSLGDRRMGVTNAKRSLPTEQRFSVISKGSLRKETRPNTASLPISNRYTDSKCAEDKQMIHHNCTAITRDAISHRSEKSENSLKKHSLFPHSTSDDGDASKVARVERSNDRSSTSSVPGKITQVSQTNPQSLSRKQNSKSPSQQQKKPANKRGALPPSRDLNHCPTGRHLDVRSDKPCICLMVKRMVIEQSKPVLYSWHGQSHFSAQQVHNTGRNLADASARESEHRSGVMSSRTNNPTLPSFQLARPTRLVRGGQGTVAWVTNTTTGHFYALKFKQRDGRSDSTWAIELREAKLLRQAKHEFIVRLFHIYETEETLFMALEWLDGGCLWNHIARSGTIHECYAVYYAACILSALRYLHEQFVVYRDMKAENIVLDHRGRPKLIDFGMAKRFARPTKTVGSRGSVGEESCTDSEDFDQPPTRYYFAAYLAPEIYDQDSPTGHLIDSWGLGYILVEMLLGYGIFLPMPWEKEPEQHLSSDWKLSLPTDAVSRLSHVCSDFVHKMLKRTPEERMSLAEAEKHNLFCRVPWGSLANLRGPDLSKYIPKSTASNRTSSSLAGPRKWMGKYDSLISVPDLAFVREFYGSIVNPSMIYTAFGARRPKYIKPVAAKTVPAPFEAKLLNHELERNRVGGNDMSRKQPKVTLDSAIEIRSTQPTANETKGNANVTRTNRRDGFQAM